MEKKTNFFKNQFRIINHQTSSEDEDNCCMNNKNESVIDKNGETCCTKVSKLDSILGKSKIKGLVYEIYELGIKKNLVYFIIFIAIGQLIEIFVPTEWVLGLFSPGKVYSVPLAAVIGLPLYVSGSASLPLLKSLLDIGAGEGAVLAISDFRSGNQYCCNIGNFYIH